jgi:hypothetical protein
MNRRLIAALALLAVVPACGSAAADRLQGAPSSPGAVPRGGRAIDWSHPLAAGRASSRTEARAAGRLGFDPIVPSWSVREKAVEVSDPAVDPAHAAVALVYEFPTGPDFPADGRVTVVETPTDQTDTDLATMVESNGAEHFHLIQVNGRPAVLIEANGIGRVRLLRHGVVIDITGPATTPDTVVRLAGAFG